MSPRHCHSRAGDLQDGTGAFRDMIAMEAPTSLTAKALRVVQ
jgi:hypothetical protein